MLYVANLLQQLSMRPTLAQIVNGNRMICTAGCEKVASARNRADASIMLP